MYFSISCSNNIKTQKCFIYFFIYIPKKLNLQKLLREKKNNQVRLGCYIQRCARVHRVGACDGTIADWYLPILMTSLRCWHDGIQTDASESLQESRALPLLSNWVLKGWGLSVAWLLLLTHFIVVGNGGLTQLSLKVQLQGELKVTLQKISRFMISGLRNSWRTKPICP